MQNTYIYAVCYLEPALQEAGSCSPRTKPMEHRACLHLASNCPKCPLLPFLKSWSPLLRTPRVPSNKLSTDQYRLGFSDASPSAFPHLLSQAPPKLRAFSVQQPSFTPLILPSTAGCCLAAAATEVPQHCK